MQKLKPYSMTEIDQSIELLIQRCHANKTMNSILSKIQFFSEVLLGFSYCLGALGEGPKAKFDQSPLYRLDSFDCVTYVNTILALALSDTLADFKQNMRKIAYRDEVNYQNRNHFMSVDWNANNAKKGIVRDITSDILGLHGEKIHENAVTWIDRPNWMVHRTYQDIKILSNISIEKQNQLLAELHGLATTVQPQLATVPFIALQQIFNHHDLKEIIFEQIPNEAVVEIVSPNWDLRDKIGTHLNISHIGLAIRKSGNIYFRHASQINKQTEERLLEEYLFQNLNHSTVKGINIHQVLVK